MEIRAGRRPSHPASIGWILTDKTKNIRRSLVMCNSNIGPEILQVVFILDVAQSNPLLKHRGEMFHLFWLGCTRTVRLMYLDPGVLQQITAGGDDRVEDSMRDDSNGNKVKASLIKQLKSEGAMGQQGVVARRDCRIVLECFEGLKPQISFCGL